MTTEPLCADADGIVRVPLLIKGRLVDPPEVSLADIEAAFAPLDDSVDVSAWPATTVVIDHAQVAREALIDRDTLTPTGGWLYHLMPRPTPDQLIETDIVELANDLYTLPFEAVLDWVDRVREQLQADRPLVERVRELDRRTATHPDPFVDAAYEALLRLLDRDEAAGLVDADLGREDVAGHRFLEGWVQLESAPRGGPVHAIGRELLADRHGDEASTRIACLRAMPTRQLHITAGNSPLVPLMSMLRAVLTKSPATIKLPYGATLPGALLARAASIAVPEHPITRHLSLVYWRGGDKRFEEWLFRPGAYDRIIVWGAPAAVASVKSRAAFTKTLCFNPRYSVSLIGAEALADVRDAARRAVADSMVQNQKACIASQVHYVEGTVEEANRYAAAVQSVLAAWDERCPQHIESHRRGKLKRLQRGVLPGASFHLNTDEQGAFTSGAIVVPDEFKIGDHPMARLIVVRPVKRLEDTVRWFHHGVATVGIHPEARRLQLRDLVAAHGVSNVVPLGQSARTFSGMSHDGMVVLSELVDWKNG